MGRREAARGIPGQDTGRATLSRELGKGDAQYFIFHAHLHSCTHTASPHTAHLECFDMALWAWPGWAAQPVWGQHNNGNRSKATARHVIKRKRCLWPHVASSCSSSCCCCSVSILAWRMSSVAAAAAPAASYLQPLEGSGFLQREAGAGLAPRPCAAITRRRKHLNVFMWKLPSPRPNQPSHPSNN